MSECSNHLELHHNLSCANEGFNADRIIFKVHQKLLAVLSAFKEMEGGLFLCPILLRSACISVLG